MRWPREPRLPQPASDRLRHLTHWHSWFAWRPVRVDHVVVVSVVDAEHSYVCPQWVWLETVERRGICHVTWSRRQWQWSYREKPMPGSGWSYT